MDPKVKNSKKKAESGYGGSSIVSDLSISPLSSSSSSLTMSYCTGSCEQGEDQTTSGCSSDMYHSKMKARKKEKVKECLKEIISIMPPGKGKGGKMGTLSALQHVLTSMRRMKEEKDKEKEKIETPLEAPKEIAGVDTRSGLFLSDSRSVASELLRAEDELRIILAPQEMTVQYVTGNLRDVLGYPQNDSWIGRSITDFVHKKDIPILTNCYKTEAEETEKEGDDSGREFSPPYPKVDSTQIVYLRLRTYKGLQESFSLRKSHAFLPFQVSMCKKFPSPLELQSCKTDQQSYRTDRTDQASSCPGSPTSMSSDFSCQSLEDKKNKAQKHIVMDCTPLVSPYYGIGEVPEVKTFHTRHTLFCNYSYIQPNAIPLLGYLPQEIVGSCIFDFYHQDDLESLLNIYKKVVSLRGTPFKSGPVRWKLKNGDFISTETEWSSFINPFSRRLEFIIGLHTIIKGPHNPAVFSEPERQSSHDDLRDQTKQIQQKIQDLLLQPIEPLSEDKDTTTTAGKKVRISDKVKVEDSTNDTSDQSLAITEQSRKYETGSSSPASKRDSPVLYTGATAYEQLNYSNNIKRFLLSQPKTYSSESDVKKSSSSEEEETEQSEEVGNADFEVDFSFPKPPSFGSSTKVLVSEQEHRGEDIGGPASPHHNTDSNLIDDVQDVPMTMPQPPTASQSKVMSLTRESLYKHTRLQEQMYLDKAKQDKTLFILKNKPGLYEQGRKGMKREHSPYRESEEECSHSDTKCQRTSDTCVNKGQYVPELLNPMFPITAVNTRTNYPRPSDSLPNTSQNTKFQPCDNRNETPMMGVTLPSHMVPLYPLVTIAHKVTQQQSVGSSSSFPWSMTESSNNTSMGAKDVRWPYYPASGVSLDPQVMVGFYQPTSEVTSMQTSLYSQAVGVTQMKVIQRCAPNPTYTASSSKNAFSPPKDVRMKSQPRKSFLQLKSEQKNPSSSDSAEDTGSSLLYVLESGSANNSVEDFIPCSKPSFPPSAPPCIAPNKPQMEPPWRQACHYTKQVQMRYRMPKPKSLKRVLKKDEDALSKMSQPELVTLQLTELLAGLNTEERDQPFIDQEAEYLFSDEDISLVYQKNKAKKEDGDFSDNSESSDYDHNHGVASSQFYFKKNGTQNKSRTEMPSEPIAHCSSSEDLNSSHSNNNLKNTDFVGDEEKQEGESFPTSSASDNGSKQESNMECEDGASTSSKDFSDLTPSDQRSNNEAGSSIKESDAMSKESDSTISKDNMVSSESDTSCSEEKKSNKTFEKLFVPLNVKFPRKKRKIAPWLTGACLNSEVKYKYSLKQRPLGDTLRFDKKNLSEFLQPDLVSKQLHVLLEDLEVPVSSTSIESSMITDTGPSDAENNVPNNDNQNMECKEDSSKENAHSNQDQCLPIIDDKIFASLFCSIPMGPQATDPISESLLSVD